MLPPTVQFVVLAACAVLLSAALLVEHRRIDTAMLRSRGAGPLRIAGLSSAEGLLLTVPATLLLADRVVEIRDGRIVDGAG